MQPNTYHPFSHDERSRRSVIDAVARPGGRSTGPIVGPIVISSVEEGNVAERSYGVQTSRGLTEEGARFFSEIDRKRSGQFTLGVWRHDSLRSMCDVAPPLRSGKMGI